MLRKIFRFYADGFRSMTVGRTLWAIILIKLFIIFAVLKLFFFPDFLAGMNDRERSRHVLRELSLPPAAAPDTTRKTLPGALSEKTLPDEGAETAARNE